MLDNYDLNVYTPSGSSGTHALVIEVMQNTEIREPGETPTEEVGDQDERKAIIPRTSGFHNGFIVYYKHSIQGLLKPLSLA